MKTVKSTFLALYLLKQMVKFDKTCIDTLLKDGKELVRFW